jgi:hypothetical protein
MTSPKTPNSAVVCNTTQTVTLYHFTSKRAARRILAQGLRANWVLDMPAELVGNMRGVWLTDDPQLPPKYSKSAESRLEVLISAADVRLIRWLPILQERMGLNKVAALDVECPELKSFYFYFGAIAARSILGFASYSTLSEMRECRKAHFDRFASGTSN